MPKYDYICKKCGNIFEIEKSMSSPSPEKCIICEEGGCIERCYSVPSIGYGNDRPIWTYKEALKYKTARHNGGPLIKIDPNKHGDRGAWHCPGEVVKENKKKE